MSNSQVELPRDTGVRPCPWDIAKDDHNRFEGMGMEESVAKLEQSLKIGETISAALEVEKVGSTMR